MIEIRDANGTLTYRLKHPLILVLTQRRNKRLIRSL